MLQIKIAGVSGDINSVSVNAWRSEYWLAVLYLLFLWPLTTLSADNTTHTGEHIEADKKFFVVVNLPGEYEPLHVTAIFQLPDSQTPDQQLSFLQGQGVAIDATQLSRLLSPEARLFFPEERWETGLMCIQLASEDYFSLFGLPQQLYCLSGNNSLARIPRERSDNAKNSSALSPNPEAALAAAISSGSSTGQPPFYPGWPGGKDTFTESWNVYMLAIWISRHLREWVQPAMADMFKTDSQASALCNELLKGRSCGEFEKGLFGKHLSPYSSLFQEQSDIRGGDFLNILIANERITLFYPIYNLKSDHTMTRTTDLIVPGAGCQHCNNLLSDDDEIIRLRNGKLVHRNCYSACSAEANTQVPAAHQEHYTWRLLNMEFDDKIIDVFALHMPREGWEAALRVIGANDIEISDSQRESHYVPERIDNILRKIKSRMGSGVGSVGEIVNRLYENGYVAHGEKLEELAEKQLGSSKKEASLKQCRAHGRRSTSYTPQSHRRRAFDSTTRRPPAMRAVEVWGDVNDEVVRQLASSHRVDGDRLTTGFLRKTEREDIKSDNAGNSLATREAYLLAAKRAFRDQGKSNQFGFWLFRRALDIKSRQFAEAVCKKLNKDVKLAGKHWAEIPSFFNE